MNELERQRLYDAATKVLYEGKVSVLFACPDCKDESPDGCPNCNGVGFVDEYGCPVVPDDL